MVELDPGAGRQGIASSRRETKGDKTGNHDGTGSSRRETKDTSLEIMTELGPVEGRKGHKPGNHDGTGSSRWETKGHKPGNHDGTNSFSLNESRTPSAEAVGGKHPLQHYFRCNGCSSCRLFWQPGCTKESICCQSATIKVSWTATIYIWILPMSSCKVIILKKEKPSTYYDAVISFCSLDLAPKTCTMSECKLKLVWQNQELSYKYWTLKGTDWIKTWIQSLQRQRVSRNVLTRTKPCSDIMLPEHMSWTMYHRVKNTKLAEKSPEKGLWLDTRYFTVYATVLTVGFVWLSLAFVLMGCWSWFEGFLRKRSVAFLTLVGLGFGRIFTDIFWVAALARFWLVLGLVVPILMFVHVHADLALLLVWALIESSFVVLWAAVVGVVVAFA